ncbi:AEC family transporter [Ignavigranum ruoffiae]|uniref:AEC family transporter n=1 Tax=Ignavigranum ruoffiae TaxID=89093 RepID=UPI0024AD08BA|nr:AEC family transporter [Ignavigranum ruoffiae]
MDLLNIFEKTLTDMNVVSAITSTVFVILVGYYCRKREIFSEAVSKILSKVVLTVALPALAFNAFMKPINQEQLQQGMSVLIWGILIYIVLIFVTKIFYLKYEGDRKTTLEILTIFGSTTFFGIPIISAIYGDEGVIYANIFNIGYRIFLYSYGFIAMSGLKMDKKNVKTMFLNPIVLATFGGLFIWLFQDQLPQVQTADGAVAFLRIDATAPWLYKPLEYLAKLSSPLAWLSIGATLGSLKFSQAASNRTAWYYTVMKIIAVPVINILGIYLLHVTGLLHFNPTSLATTVIMMATPTATVAAAYAINFDKDAVLASNASLLSTLAAVIMIPLWIVILEIISQTGLL